MSYYCRDLKVRIIGTPTGIPAHVGQSFLEAQRYLDLHVIELVSALSQEMEHHPWEAAAAVHALTYWRGNAAQ